MANSQLPCRIRIEKAEDNDTDSIQPQESAVFTLRDCPDIGTEIRTQWARELMKYFGDPKDCIRPWDFLARLDGSVESLTLSSSEGKVYPARFQIPPSTLCELDRSQKVSRAEKFAMASLLYEIMSGKEPFQELTDDEVQRRFSNGDFPDDAASLPNSLFIYSGWSEEFSQELTKRVEAQDVTILQGMSNYAKAHPILTGIQVVGLTLSAVSFLAVPVLGVVGFTAAGPAAGSVAAAWQASIGAVRAGSLFAWCQSAAMGGTALSGIQIAGVAGTALTKVADVPGLVEIFKGGFRTATLNQAGHMMHIFYESFNFTDASSIGGSVAKFVYERSLFLQIWAWVSDQGHHVLEWLKQPHVLVLITTWWITFTVVLLLLFAVGFNPVGIGAGTLAAAFQSFAYGGFTPAGGIFATLTSMGMLGVLMPLEASLAAVIATATTMTVWAFGVGRS